MNYPRAMLAVAFFGGFGVAAAIAEPTFKTANVASPDATLLENVTRVCQPGAFVLSDKALVACTTEQFPRLSSDGRAFVNQGIGVEFNVLIRQIKKTATN